MIDTIKFTIREKHAKIWRLNINPERQADTNTFSGHCKNLRINESLNGVTIQGSIAKYYNGDNITNFSRHDYKKALEQLEQETGLNLQEAILQRVDFAHTVIVKNPTMHYLDLFDEMGIYKMNTVRNKGLESITYFTPTGARAFCGYDKIKEMTDKKETIPELYQGDNVLRLEYRIVRRAGIKKYLGKGQDISPHDLTDKETYNELKKQSINFYNSIPKVGRLVFLDGAKEVTPKNYNDTLAEYCRQMNPESSKLFLQDMKSRGLISQPNYERIKAQEKKNLRNYTFTDTNILIAELDDKIR